MCSVDGRNPGDPEEPADRGHGAGATQGQGQNERGQFILNAISYLSISLNVSYSGMLRSPILTKVFLFYNQENKIFIVFAYFSN